MEEESRNRKIFSTSPANSSDSEDEDFEFCYRFRPLYADEAGPGHGQEEEGAPWMSSGSGIRLPAAKSLATAPSTTGLVGAKGSVSDGYVATLLEHRKSQAAAAPDDDAQKLREAKGKEKAPDTKNESDATEQKRTKKNESDMKAAAKRNSAPPSTDLGKRIDTAIVRSAPGMPEDNVAAAAAVDASLLITEEDERETMTITRAQWKRWQHQEAYMIALTRELERLRQQMADMQLPSTPRSAVSGESDKDRKMREFKEMMAARYSNIRTNAEGHKAQVIVDYYANRLEQRQKNVRARANGSHIESENGSTPASTPRPKPNKGKGKKGTRESSSSTPSLGSSSSGSSLLARFKSKS